MSDFDKQKDGIMKAGGLAFPITIEPSLQHPTREVFPGMTLLDYFAGQALSNSRICTGEATEYQLREWFGDRGGITKEEIVAKQALSYADAMLEARK